MSDNLLELLKQAVNPGLVQGLSKYVGDSETSVQSGLGSLIPVLIGGLANRAGAANGAASVFSQVTSPNIDAGLLGSLGGLLGNSGQASNLINVGKSILGGLFGPKAEGIGDALSQASGMRAASAGTLATLVAPVVLGFLKKLVTDRGLNAGGLATLLLGQKDFLAGKLNPGLLGALGFASPAALLGGLGNAAGAAGAAVAGGARAAGAATATAATAAAAGSRSWWPWILGAAVLLLLFSQLKNCGQTTPPATSQSTPAVTAPAAAPAAPAPAPAAAAILPAKVYFETGKAEVGAEGTATIQAAAAELAKGTGKVFLTGFTDKTGDAALNEELAKNRAGSVKAALVAAGVAESRIEGRPPVFVEIGANGADAEARRVEISAE